MLWMGMGLVLQNKEKEKEKNKQSCPVDRYNCFEINTKKSIVSASLYSPKESL